MPYIQLILRRFIPGMAILLSLPAQASLSRSELAKDIKEAARRAALDPKLVQAVIAVESNFKVTAVSPKGAQGLMQVMPTTGAECGITEPYHTTNHLMGACEC